VTVSSTQTLIDQARSSTGLDDFGVDGWQVGLEHLLDGVERDLGEHPSAVTWVEATVVRRLVIRLEIEDWYARQGPDEPPGVDGPLVILGLPRTATTALHYLLGVDPQFRFPRMWEMAAPVPPPELADEAADPRRLAMPDRGGDVRHITSVDGPVEDVFVHALHFGSQDLSIPVPTYLEWWRGTDLRGTFAYQEHVLRLLHSHRPPHRWLLKAPAYLFHVPEMAEHYPGARFVMTHRDPVAALPSTCSVVMQARQGVPGRAQDEAELGAEMLHHFSEGVRATMAARAHLDPARFLDVGQAEVQEDPVGTAARIYGHFGLEMSEPVEQAMGEWAAANQRGSRGAHVYSAEEYGLTADRIRETFADYCDAYGRYLVTPTR